MYTNEGRGYNVVDSPADIDPEVELLGAPGVDAQYIVRRVRGSCDTAWILRGGDVDKLNTGSGSFDIPGLEIALGWNKPMNIYGESSAAAAVQVQYYIDRRVS